MHVRYALCAAASAAHNDRSMPEHHSLFRDFWYSTCVAFAHQCLTAHCREDCEGYISSVWDWLEGLGTGISRADSSTWRAPHWPPAFKGIINSLEVSHQAFVWRVRSNMRLIKVSLSAAPIFLMYNISSMWPLRKHGKCHPA